VTPEVAHRYRADLDAFAARGLRVLPVLFMGSRGSATYPLDLVGHRLSFHPEVYADVVGLNPAMDLNQYFSLGALCNAGSSAVVIRDDWTVVPCQPYPTWSAGFDEDWPLVEKVIYCPVRICPCKMSHPSQVLPLDCAQARVFYRTLARRGAEAPPRWLTGLFGRRHDAPSAPVTDDGR